MQSRTFHLSIRIYYEDTDAGGVVYYANYLRYLERARTECLRQLGFEQSALMAQGIAFAARSAQVEYLRPARLDDEIRVETTVESLKRAQVVFVQRILRGPELLVDATMRIACLDLARGKATAMPREVFEKFSTLMKPEPKS